MPLRIYRRGSGDVALGIGAVAANVPGVFPIPGFARLIVEGRSPAVGSSWTLQVSTGPVSGGTATVLATVVCTPAVPAHVPIALSGELGALTLTNGPVAQSPEVLVTLEEE